MHVRIRYRGGGAGSPPVTNEITVDHKKVSLLLYHDDLGGGGRGHTYNTVHKVLIDNRNEREINITEQEYLRLVDVLRRLNHRDAEVLNQIAEDAGLPRIWSLEDIDNLTGMEV